MRRSPREAGIIVTPKGISGACMLSWGERGASDRRAMPALWHDHLRARRMAAPATTATGVALYRLVYILYDTITGPRLCAATGSTSASLPTATAMARPSCADVLALTDDTLKLWPVTLFGSARRTLPGRVDPRRAPPPPGDGDADAGHKKWFASPRRGVAPSRAKSPQLEGLVRNAPGAGWPLPASRRDAACGALLSRAAARVAGECSARHLRRRDGGSLCRSMARGARTRSWARRMDLVPGRLGRAPCTSRASTGLSLGVTRVRNRCTPSGRICASRRVPLPASAAHAARPADAHTRRRSQHRRLPSPRRSLLSPLSVSRPRQSGLPERARPEVEPRVHRHHFPDFDMWRQRTHSFTALGLIGTGNFNLAIDGAAERCRVRTSPGIFRARSTSPPCSAGRSPLTTTGRRGERRHARYGFWQSAFGGRRTSWGRRCGSTARHSPWSACSLPQRSFQAACNSGRRSRAIPGRTTPRIPMKGSAGSSRA